MLKLRDGQRRRSAAAEAQQAAVSDAFVDVQDLSKTFVGDSGISVDAVRNVSCHIPEGQFVCLVGPSGHGKSTLLYLIAGLLPPSGGTVHVGGKVVTGPGADRGLVFQQDTLFMWRRVADNVAYGLQARGIARPERSRVVGEYLRLVGLTDKARSWPKELSGGMRKRVALAAVFANDPALLLMDEPFGSVDYVQRAHLHDVVLDLWTRTHKTILFVTHDVDEAITLSDRILVMVNGQIADDFLVPIERPRTEDSRTSQTAVALRKRMLEHLGISVSASQRLRAREQDNL